jgi:hypothetical protein
MASREGAVARLGRVWRERTRRPLDETTAWAVLIANQLLWPGIGGAALRQVEGVVQMVLSLATGLVAIAAGARIVLMMMEGNVDETLWPLFRQMAVGFAGFVAIWLWALVSGLRLLRESRSGRL